jgi:glucokinase
MSARAALAVDLGGTKLAAAAIDEGGSFLWRAKNPVARRSVDDTAHQIARMAAEAAQVTGLSFEAAGCLVPGIVRESDGAAWAPNLWGMEFEPLGEALRSRLSWPVFLENDRTGHLLGEVWKGAAQGATDAIFVAAGTGIGAGILAGGRLVTGARGIAGSAGWMCLAEAWRDEYRDVGCYEWQAAGPALARLASEAKGQKLDSAAVVAAAEAGEAWAIDLIERIAQAHGRAIANLVSLLDPEVVVLGGGLMSNAALFLEGIRREMLRWAQPVAARAVRLTGSELGADAGLLGAARLALWPDEIR